LTWDGLHPVGRFHHHGNVKAVNSTTALPAIGTVGIVGLTLAVIAYISGHSELSQYLTIPYLRGNGELAVYCAALVGAALGFLWFNSYPAQVFMGDTGSLALGGIIGAMCVLMKKELLLPTLGGVFLMETISVIISVVLRMKRRWRRAPRSHGPGSSPL
jgi:phospho-N-acetylmuramoyl-pentapeptide-transferase